MEAPNVLLFLTGLELIFDRLRRFRCARRRQPPAIPLAPGGVLRATGFATSPLLFAVILLATSVDIVNPILATSARRSRSRTVTEP